MKIREMSDRQRDRQTGMTTILVEYFFFLAPRSST